MNEKQQRFVEEYLLDLNATQAAIRAGYSENTAYSQGQRLLKNVEVMTALAEARQEVTKEIKIDQQYVLSNLQELAERCMQKTPVMERRGNETVQATDEEGNHIWAFNAAGAAKALELLGKYLGMFTDKHQVDHIHYAVSNGRPTDVDEWQQRYKQLQ